MMHPERAYWIPIGREPLAVSQTDHERYFSLILKAKEARTYPHQSGFPVLTAALTADGMIVTGGNKEYAFSDAFIHGETAVISHVRDEYGNVPIRAIAFYNPEPMTEFSSACPCGNCRDIMRHYCTPDMVLIEGNEQRAIISRLKDYFFDNFHPMDVSDMQRKGVDEAKRALTESVSVYLPESLRSQLYGVTIVSKGGSIWRGSLHTNAGYDAVTPLLSAVQTWRNTLPQKDWGKHLDIERIVVTSAGQIPDVLYRDRQAALEFDEVLMKYSGRKSPLPVFLVNIDRNGHLLAVQTTDTREWLPYPFSPASFGMEAVLEAQLSLFRPRT